MILPVIACWLALLATVTVLLLQSGSLRRRERVSRRLEGLRPPGEAGQPSRFEGLLSALRLERGTRAGKAVTAAAPALLVLVLTGAWWSLCVTLPCGLLLSRLLERAKEARRRELLRAQLYDFLDAMIQSLEGGFSVFQALEFSSEDVAPPLNLELRRAVSDIQYGSEFEEALARLRENVGEPELDTIIDMLLLLKQSGGNLPLLLRKLRGIMRDRAEIARDLRVYTTQGRWSGYVVSALPVAFLCIESVLSPALIRPLVATPLGVALLATGLCMDAAGFFCVRRISRLGRA
jgi:tight adherence protein B